MNTQHLPEWANGIPLLGAEERAMSEAAVNAAWAEQVKRVAAEKAEWLRVLAPDPQPHHNTQVRDVESFTERQRKRMKIAGWFKQRGESALDVLLAIAIGAALAAVLFFGWSS